jgi:hypothetical protein
MRSRRRDANAEPVSMSWRNAGGVVSHLACKGGCYLGYYCSGNEGIDPTRIREALGGLGWIPSPWPEERRVSSTHRSTAETSATAIRKRAGLLDPTPDQEGAFWRENEPHILPGDDARVPQAWFWTLDWLLGELEADREAESDPGVVYEDAESFKAALHAAHSE